jgi:hypothetical protein
MSRQDLDKPRPEHPAMAIRKFRLGSTIADAQGWEGQIRPSRNATPAEREKFVSWRARQLYRVTGWMAWQGWLRENGVALGEDESRAAFDAWFLEARHYEWDLFDAWMASKQFAAWAGW